MINGAEAANPMKELSSPGLWWVPPTKQRVGGTLTFSNQEGIRLSLLGSLREMTDLDGLRNYPLIVGLTSDGNLITLYDCVQGGFRQTSSGFRSEEYLANVAYIGAHFTDVGQVRFDAAYVRYSYLSEWIGMSGFKWQNLPDNDEGSSLHGITYSRPKEIEATIGNEKVAIRFSSDFGGDWLRRLTFGQSAWFTIDSSDELELDNWNRRFVFPLQNLLTLATDSPNAIAEFFVFSRQKTFTLTDGESARRPIQVICRTLYQNRQPDEVVLSPHMLFAFKDVANDFGTIIDRWLKVANELDSVCNLFFTVQYTPSMYLEQQFLSIVQAVESYHRKRYRKGIFPEEQHRALVNSVLMQTPKEYRKWLHNRLRYSNEPTLRDRLTDLIELTHDVSLPLNSAATPSRKAFIRKVVDTRNFLTHYDSSAQKNAADGFELHRLTQVLSFLLQACFLLELGLTPERCAELIRRTPRWQRTTDEAMWLRKP